MGLGSWLKAKAFRRAVDELTAPYDTIEEREQMADEIKNKGVSPVMANLAAAAVGVIVAAIQEVAQNGDLSDLIANPKKLVAAIAAAVLFRLAHSLQPPKPPKPPNPDMKAGAIAGLVACFMFASPALAQDPAPTPAVSIDLHGGALRTMEKDREDRIDMTYRLAISVPAPGGFAGFARADWTRTTDGGDLLDPHTFRSVEAFVGGRKRVASGIEVQALTGVTWSREGEKLPPNDPRLWTLAGGIRGSIEKRGSLFLGFGHHGPVGGPAVLGSLSYRITDASIYFCDFALSTDAERFKTRPGSARCGISARLKGWRF